jgi:hypothetical protein
MTYSTDGRLARAPSAPCPLRTWRIASAAVSRQPGADAAARCTQVAHAEESRVVVIDSETGNEMLSVEGSDPENRNVQGIHLSPSGAYLVTCTRWVVARAELPQEWAVRVGGGAARAESVLGRNLLVWHVRSGRLVAALAADWPYNPDRWPYLHFAPGESLACRVMAAGIETVLFPTHGAGEAVTHVHPVRRAAALSMAPRRSPPIGGAGHMTVRPDRPPPTADPHPPQIPTHRRPAQACGFRAGAARGGRGRRGAEGGAWQVWVDEEGKEKVLLFKVLEVTRPPRDLSGPPPPPSPGAHPRPRLTAPLPLAGRRARAAEAAAGGEHCRERRRGDPLGVRRLRVPHAHHRALRRQQCRRPPARRARACARGTLALVGNGLPVSGIFKTIFVGSTMWSNTPQSRHQSDPPSPRAA